MRKRAVAIPVLLSVFIVSLGLLAACGSGGGGGSSITYSGSTDPAVADSTSAAALAEYAMGAGQAGFPVAQAFAGRPPRLNAPPAAQSLVAFSNTMSVVIQVPADAGMYAPGAGSAALDGSATLLLGNNDAQAATWTVIEGVFDGTVTFDGFEVEEGGIALDGTAEIFGGLFFFSNLATFNTDLGDFTGDPGFPLWQSLDLTADSLSLGDTGDSWALGEVDWTVVVWLDSIEVYIWSQTVAYEGKTYKLEDTLVEASFGVGPVQAPAAQPLLEPVSGTVILISGTTASHGLFYHPDLGKLWFSGDIGEEMGDITTGQLSFFDGPEGASLFDVYFGWNGATVYNIWIPADEYLETGYLVDGSFVPDPEAPILIF